MELKDILAYIDCLRPRYLCPDHKFNNLSNLDEDFLETRDIAAVVLDVDQTLTIYHGEFIDSRVKRTFQDFCENPKIKVFILSNCDEQRYKELNKIFKSYQAELIKPEIKKPLNGAYQIILDYLKEEGISPNQVAMIGDRLWTDIAGANRQGFTTIKVEALDKESEEGSKIPFFRWFENHLLRTYQLLERYTSFSLN
jgi:HAD superfamily phosphatase (TIGR01668 family)